MKSRSICGAGGTTDAVEAVGDGVAGGAAAGACATGAAELAGAGGADGLREVTPLGALAPGGDVAPGRTFGAAAARALAQLAKLCAASVGAEVSGFVMAAVEAGLPGAAAVLAPVSPLVAG